MHALFKQNFISDQRDLQRGFSQQLTTELTRGDEAIYLKKHQHLRMHDACGWTVHAVGGTLWITQDGDMRDIVLEAGQSFVIDRKDTAVLSPLNEAQVVLKRGHCRQPARNRAEQSRSSRAFSFSAVRALPA
jgi:hypothetical protein